MHASYIADDENAYIHLKLIHNKYITADIDLNSSFSPNFSNPAELHQLLLLDIFVFGIWKSVSWYNNPQKSASIDLLFAEIF